MILNDSIRCISIALAVDLVPKILTKIFPLVEDPYIGHAARRAIREKVENWIDARGPRTRYVWDVMLPNNLGLAAGIQAYLFSTGGPTALIERWGLRISMILTLMSAIYITRFIFANVLAPLSRDYLPERVLGFHLEPLFREIGS